MSIVDKLKQRLVDAKHILDIVDPELAMERINICNSCDYLTTLRRCKNCGCFMDAKTKLAGAECPIKRW